MGPAIPTSDRFLYRNQLFQELLAVAGDSCFAGHRVLEIGPKDGQDSLRLASLHPKELVLIDLPEKREMNETWIGKISCQTRYIEANLMYMPEVDFVSLGQFKLIWCTGVLYHNAEQLRFIRKLFRLLDVGGFLVLESATLRLSPALRAGAFVEVHYPETYRNTGTITHLPTKAAIKAWLMMVGFKEIHDSDCYRKFNRSLIGLRYACISKKNAEDDADCYYKYSSLNPRYPFGDSV